MHQILGMQQVFCSDGDSETICRQLIVSEISMCIYIWPKLYSMYGINFEFHKIKLILSLSLILLNNNEKLEVFLLK